MFTASHNPAQYNGIKLCRAGARPVGQDTGLAQVRDLGQAILDSGSGFAREGTEAGTVTERDVLGDYAAYLRSLVDLSQIRPLKVVVDAGNGMGGHTVPAVLGTGAGLDALPLEVVPLYFELDGTFPNHEANPLEPENLRDLQAAVLEHGADLGLAFDGDADRCFVIDERGEAVSPSAITAMVATREIAREAAAGPGREGRIVYNVISSAAVPEIISEHGARGGAHPRGPLLHQGRDGRCRRRVRRRAQRALLLPRLLVRRHRHARGHARPRRPGWAGEPLSELTSGLQPVCRVRRDQLDRHRRRRGHRAGARSGRPRRARGSTPSTGSPRPTRERTATRCGG